MNDAERADLLQRLVEVELKMVEFIGTAYESKCEQMNRIYEAHGLDPIPFDDVGVEITRFTNEVRMTMIELETA